MKIKLQLKHIFNINCQQFCWWLLLLVLVGFSAFNKTTFNDFEAQKSSFKTSAFDKFFDYQVQLSQEIVETECSSNTRTSYQLKTKLSNFSKVEFVLFNSGFNNSILLNSSKHIVSSDSEISICFRV